jgi:hypothetical protein
LDVDLPTDNAWMLPDEDRAWLSFRLAQLLLGELKFHLGKEQEEQTCDLSHF